MPQGLTKNHHDPFIMARKGCGILPFKSYDVSLFHWESKWWRCQPAVYFQVLDVGVLSTGNPLWKKAMSLGWLKTVLLSRWSMISLATNRWSITYWWKQPPHLQLDPGAHLVTFPWKAGQPRIFLTPSLVGGWTNPFEKYYMSNWILSPGFGVNNKNYSKPPPAVISWIYPPGPRMLALHHQDLQKIHLWDRKKPELNLHGCHCHASWVGG